jgi:hypothetical protein
MVVVFARRAGKQGAIDQQDLGRVGVCYTGGLAFLLSWGARTRWEGEGAIISCLWRWSHTLTWSTGYGKSGV